MHLLSFLTAGLHDIIKGKRHEGNLLEFTLLPALHQARELILVSVVGQVRVAAGSPVEDPGTVPSRRVQGGPVQIHAHVPSTTLFGRMHEEEPGLSVGRQEGRAASFAFGVVVRDKFRSGEADDAALTTRRGLHELRGHVGLVEIQAAVFA